MKYQEPKLSSLFAASKLLPKLAVYNVEWFDLSAMKNKCLKHTTIKNLPDTQEGQLLFLLSKFDASEIKTAFADAIGNVGKAARKVFYYPLPGRKRCLLKVSLSLFTMVNPSWLTI
jgi:hypothetical protein